MSAMAERIARAREAQKRWAARPVRERLRHLRRFRALIAREGIALAAAAGSARGRPVAEKLTTEVIPLAAAVQFLEENAVRLLRTRPLGRGGRPVWLSGVATEIRREAFGIVLVVGPANYPLFLPGVQTIQALAAGNAVLLKPGRDGTAAASACAELLSGSRRCAGPAPGPAGAAGRSTRGARGRSGFGGFHRLN